MPDLSALDPTRALAIKQADATRTGAPRPPPGPPTAAAKARARVFIAREWNNDQAAIEETAKAGKLTLLDLHVLQANHGAVSQRHPNGGRGSLEELEAAIVMVCQELFPPPETKT